LVTVDTCNDAFNIGSEIVSKVSIEAFRYLSDAPVKLAAPNVPVPTSHHLTRHYYPTKISVVNAVLGMLGLNTVTDELSFDELNFGPKDII